MWEVVMVFFLLFPADDEEESGGSGNCEPLREKRKGFIAFLERLFFEGALAAQSFI